MQKPNVVILGGGYAGLMAASRVARQGIARVTVIDRNAHFEQRIRLHQVLAGAQVPRGDLAQWLSRGNIHFLAAAVHEVSPETRLVITSAGPIRYDYLVIALGSQIAHHQIPGALHHTHCIGSQSECEQLSGKIARLAGEQGHLLLVGGGLTQIETAAELAERFPALRLSLLCSGNPFKPFSPQAERYFREFFHTSRITLIEGCSALSFENGICNTSAGRLAFDMCLCAPGFEAAPVLKLLDSAKDDVGRVRVLPTLQTPLDERILITGDSASCPWPGPVDLRMGCAVALPMGAHAGENVGKLIKGQSPSDFSFGFFFRCVSLGRSAGVVQFTHWDDTPKPRTFTGKQGAWIKEQICRMTYLVPRWELLTKQRLYHWPSAGNACNMNSQSVMDSSNP